MKIFQLSLGMNSDDTTAWSVLSMSLKWFPVHLGGEIGIWQLNVTSIKSVLLCTLRNMSGFGFWKKKPLSPHNTC